MTTFNALQFHSLWTAALACNWWAVSLQKISALWWKPQGKAVHVESAHKHQEHVTSIKHRSERNQFQTQHQTEESVHLLFISYFPWSFTRHGGLVILIRRTVYNVTFSSEHIFQTTLWLLNHFLCGFLPLPVTNVAVAAGWEGEKVRPDFSIPGYTFRGLLSNPPNIPRDIVSRGLPGVFVQRDARDAALPRSDTSSCLFKTSPFTLLPWDWL